ncbi:MAG: hypothetical protein QM765_05725 [Myxococcales bacterium]
MPTAPVREGSGSSPSSLGALSRGPRPSIRAMPQSMSTVSPNSPTMTLSGLRSRWTTPRLWAKATALHRFQKAPRCRSRSGSELQAASALESERPRTRRIV